MTLIGDDPRVHSNSLFPEMIPREDIISQSKLEIMRNAVSKPETPRITDYLGVNVKRRESNELVKA